MTRSLSPSISWGLAALLLLLIALPARAQDVYADNDQQWWTNLEQQLSNSLDSKIPSIQASALQNIIYFASHHKDKADCLETVPGLLRIYEYHTDESVRVMALMALHTISDDVSMQQLQRLVKAEKSDYVRSLTLAALADHYKVQS